MTPEERAAERFARESQRKFRKELMFNLEEDEEEEMQLTHGGQSISFDDNTAKDDFHEDDIGESDNDLSGSEQARKRKRVFAADDSDDMEGLAADGEEEDQPERKKTKAEVMKEVIAKSKFYKYERQKAKEDDDELRAELDKGLPDLFDVIRGTKQPPTPEPPKEDTTALMNPDRAALLQGKDRDDADREYDIRLKQMAYDKRSKPTDRTMTEEEKAQEEAKRLKSLEEERLRRMRGEEQSDSEVEADGQEDEESIPDDAKSFGLIQASSAIDTRPDLGVEDEDDFIIDDDLVDIDSHSDLSFIQSDEEDLSGQEESELEEEEADDQDEMFNDAGTSSGPEGHSELANAQLAFTYPCPESHQNFLEIIKDVKTEDLPLVVQRIRALHHPRLHSDNKAKLARFSAILVEHVAYMANQPDRAAFIVLESLLRHIHSMAKGNSEIVAKAFRAHLRSMAAERPLDLLPGDLVILTGVLTVFPTSDHFHPVVTPANLSLARYLGQGAISALSDLATGAYVGTLAVQYQSFAKRLMPEFMNYCLNALCVLSPLEIKENLGAVSLRAPEKSLRLNGAAGATLRKPQFWDILEKDLPPKSAEELKISLIGSFVSLLDSAADLWSSNSAFYEVFEPVRTVLRHLSRACSKRIPSQLEDHIKSTLDKVDQLCSRARLARRPLLLHNHRPLAIKTSIPKFEEDFNPERHYDPNRDRAELNRLRAEHKRERKGAMRELRKDANFIAREALREKKEQDAAYEKKYKRLIAEIQGEEGKEAKAYEREKRMRQGKK
jgi:nucleolar protein 14